MVAPGIIVGPEPAVLPALPLLLDALDFLLGQGHQLDIGHPGPVGRITHRVGAIGDNLGHPLTHDNVLARQVRLFPKDIVDAVPLARVRAMRDQGKGGVRLQAHQQPGVVLVVAIGPDSEVDGVPALPVQGTGHRRRRRVLSGNQHGSLQSIGLVIQKPPAISPRFPGKRRGRPAMTQVGEIDRFPRFRGACRGHRRRNL